MVNRQMLPCENAISVEGFYSLYHSVLSDFLGIGELHDFYEIVYVESGFYYVILDGKKHVVPPGNCIFFAPNSYHSGDENIPINATVKIVSFECSSQQIGRFDNRVFALTDTQKQLFLQAFESAKNTVEHTPGHNLKLKDTATFADLQCAKNQLELFLIELYKSTPSIPKPSGKTTAKKAEFTQISDYLKANLHRAITLDDICAECSVSLSKLKALCSFYCGCGPIDYLISLRIIRAKYLILEGKLNFSEIATKTGFASPHYFSRVFKERTGLTPSGFKTSPNHIL